MTRIGYISSQPGAKVHMEIDGQGIADNHGRHIVTLVADADIRTLKAEHLCKRCFRAARVRAAQATLINRTGLVASHLRSLLQRAAEAVKTLDERAEIAELIERSRGISAQDWFALAG